MYLTRFVFFVFFFLPYLVKAQLDYQSYYSSINLAEHFYIKGEFSKSDSCFKKAFSTAGLNTFNQDYLFAAVNALGMKDTTLTCSYLTLFASKGGRVEDLRNKYYFNIYLDSLCPQLYSLVFYTSKKHFKKNMLLCYKAYKKTLNKKLIRKVNRLVFIDQRIARNFLVVKTSKKIMFKITGIFDPITFKKLIAICEKYGWPGYNLIGENKPNGKATLGGVELLIRHFTKENLKKIEPYILHSIQQLQTHPSSWATCMDYIYMATDIPVEKGQPRKAILKQIYGTMYRRKKELIPFGKIDEVNANRALLFLSNIEDYAKISGKKLPTEEVQIITENKK